MAKKTKKHITYSYGIYNDTGESYLKGYNVSEFTEKSKFNGNRFLSVMKLIILIALSVLLFSWGSRGFIDSKYTNSYKDYTFNEYYINNNNQVATRTNSLRYYDYDWTIKINQLSTLRNVFTLPDTSGDSFYSRFNQDLFLLVEHLFEEGFIYGTSIKGEDYYYVINGLEQLKYSDNQFWAYTSLNSIYNPLKGNIGILYDKAGLNKVMRFHSEYSDTLLQNKINASQYFSNYSLQQLKDLINFQFIPVSYYCYVDDNYKVAWYEDLIYDSRSDFTKDLTKVITLFAYPFTCIYNFMFDLGVLFRFAIVW